MKSHVLPSKRKAVNLKDGAAPLCPDGESYRGSSAPPGSWHGVPPCAAGGFAGAVATDAVVESAAVVAIVAVVPLIDGSAASAPGAVPGIADLAIAIAPAKVAICPASASGFAVDLAEPFVAVAVHCSAGVLVAAHVHLTDCGSVDGFDFSVGCVVVASPGWRAVVLLAQFAAVCGVRSALRYSHRCATPSAVLAGGDRLANCENGCVAVTDLQGSHPIGGCGAG